MKIEIAVRLKAFVVKVGSTNSGKVRDCDHHSQSLYGRVIALGDKYAVVTSKQAYKKLRLTSARAGSAE